MNKLYRGYYLLKWMWHGFFNYTRQGFERHSAEFSTFDDVHIIKLVVIVTGGSSGIGYAAVERLSQFPNMQIHMVCSNEGRGRDSLSRLVPNTHPSSKILLHIVDLTDLKAVKRFALDFVSRDIKVHVLVNNAGMLPLEYNTVKNSDIEYGFALNVLAIKMLTEGLLPIMRIPFTSGALTESLNFEDPGHMHSMDQLINNFDGVALYAEQKRAQIHLTEYWAEKYPMVQFMTMHPGWVDTPGVEKSLPTFYKNMKSRLRTPAQGADTIVYLAVHPDVDKDDHSQGLLYFDRKPVDKFIASSQKPTKDQINRFVDNVRPLQQRY